MTVTMAEISSAADTLSATLVKINEETHAAKVQFLRASGWVTHGLLSSGAGSGPEWESWTKTIGPGVYNLTIDKAVKTQLAFLSKARHEAWLFESQKNERQMAYEREQAYAFEPVV